MSATDAAWRRRLAEILSQPAFHPAHPGGLSLFAALWNWFIRVLSGFHIHIGAVSIPVGVGWVVLPAVLAVLVFLLARVSRAHQVRPGTSRTSGAAPTPANHLRLAEESIARGAYPEAARHLFEAAVTHLAALGELLAASTKTNGDYARELRRRRSSAQSSFQTLSRGCDELWYHAASHADDRASAYNRVIEIRRAVDQIMTLRGEDR